jgi:hypothetical protein
MKRMHDGRDTADPGRYATQGAGLCRVSVHDMGSKLAKSQDELSQGDEILARINGAAKPRDSYRDDSLQSEDLGHLDFAR